jgi:succinate dehydrogenase / fumarate reductase cytochrome b subunit
MEERPRRLHTIAGAIVLGAVLVEHLATNASVLGGAESYENVVGAIQRWPLTGVFEVVFILLPLAFHALYGLKLLKDEASIERYGSRRLWAAQRVSAVFMLVFVLGHFWEVRAQRLFYGAGPETTFTVLSAHLSWTWAGIPWVAFLYVLGIGATCFHFANGLFAASALRGMATSRMRILTSLIGGSLFILGFLSVLGFATGTRLSNPPAGDDVSCGEAMPSAVPLGSSRP